MRALIWSVTGAFVVLELLQPAFYQLAQPALAAGLILVGALHGTLDSWLAARIAPQLGRWFYATYIGAIGVVLVTWWLSPALSLAGFFLLSAHHFGQSDLAHLELRRRRLPLFLTRGAMVLALPLLLHQEDVATIFAALGVPLEIGAWGMRATIACAAVVIHVGLLALLLRGRTRVRELADIAVLLPLLAVATPLVAFAVYFTAWHATSHLRNVRRRWASDESTAEWLEAGLPIAAATLVGAVAIGTWAWRLPADARWAALFLSLAAVTLPHSVLVGAAVRWRSA